MEGNIVRNIAIASLVALAALARPAAALDILLSNDDGFSFVGIKKKGNEPDYFR